MLFLSPDQVQHIVTETRDKIMQYKSKMADEADLRRRLANLEESVELHEHMKRQVTHSLTRRVVASCDPARLPPPAPFPLPRSVGSPQCFSAVTRRGSGAGDSGAARLARV